MNNNKYNLQDFINTIKRSNLFIIAGLVVVLLSSIITIAQGVSIIKNQYEKSIGYKRELIKDLEQLTADVHIGYFTSILGNAVFVNKYENKGYNVEKIKNIDLTEYIFVNKYCFVQALTDKNDQVLAYSITTRKSDFNPRLMLNINPVVDVTLGKTKFKELPDVRVDNIVSYLGAHDFYYHEAYYFGNPGNYQTFIFTLNESGYAGIEEELEFYTFIPPSKDFKEKILISDPEIQEFRNEAIINTFTVSSPGKFFGESLNNFRFGPDYNQIRILPRN